MDIYQFIIVYPCFKNSSPKRQVFFAHSHQLLKYPSFQGSNTHLSPGQTHPRLTSAWDASNAAISATSSSPKNSARDKARAAYRWNHQLAMMI